MGDRYSDSDDYRRKKRRLSPENEDRGNNGHSGAKYRHQDLRRDDERGERRKNHRISEHSRRERRRSRSPRNQGDKNREHSAGDHTRRPRSQEADSTHSRRHRSPLTPNALIRPKDIAPYSHTQSKRSKIPLPSQQEAYTGDTSVATVQPPIPAEKQKPNFAPSGKLAAETNTAAGTTIVLKYNEPPESRKPPPSQPWRLYVFKGSETLETVELGTRSCWLFGRERSVVDFPIEHPSCSKQHAVLQFRFVEKKNEYGDKEGKVRPYVIDLESANGTKVNGELLPERRFVEIRSGDVVAFGDSTREYVLMLPPPG